MQNDERLISSRRSTFRLRLPSGFPLRCELSTPSCIIFATVVDLSQTGAAVKLSQGSLKKGQNLNVTFRLELLPTQLESRLDATVVRQVDGVVGIQFVGGQSPDERIRVADYMKLFLSSQTECRRRKRSQG